MCFLIFSSTCTRKIDQFLSSRDYISWDSLWGGCHWVTFAAQKKRQVLYVSSCHGKLGMSFSVLSNAVAKIFFFFFEVWFQHSKVSSERSNKRACVTHRTRNSIRVSKFYRSLQRLRVDRPCEAELRRVLQFRILVEICLRNFDSSVDNSREPSRYFLLQPLIHTFWLRISSWFW